MCRDVDFYRGRNLDTERPFRFLYIALSAVIKFLVMGILVVGYVIMSIIGGEVYFVWFYSSINDYYFLIFLKNRACKIYYQIACVNSLLKSLVLIFFIFGIQ